MEEQFENGDYWNPSPQPQVPSQFQQLPVNSPKVQVMPAPTVNTLSNTPDPLVIDGEDKDKFKCLYLLVETAVAVRQREKEQRDAQM